MTTEVTTPSSTPAQPAAPSTSVPAGTTGQGAPGSSLLSTPPAEKAAGATDAATPTDQPKAGDAGEGADGKPKGEPTAADIELKLPDGFSADEAVLGEFKSLAKEAGLKGEAAQKFIDLYAKTEMARAQQLQTEQAARNDKWADASRADKEFGGKSFGENLAVAQQALARFGSKELQAALNETGLGNHPELIRAFVKVGKAISEDSIRGGSGNGGVDSQEAIHRSLYPTMFKDS